jgi:hypothetical protein
MKRAFAVVALLAAAVATWLALRGDDAPSNEPPIVAAKSDRAAPRKRTGPVEAVPTETPADAPTVSSDDDAAKPSTPETIEIGEPVETAAPPPLDGTEPIAVGRLVDGSGAPIAGFAVVAHVLDVGEAWSPLVQCTTDADGRFRFVLGRPKGDPTTPKLEIGRRIAAPELIFKRSIALIDLPPTLPAGEIVVGDVVYRGTAILAAGVVVDAAGRPLPGVEIRAMNVDAHNRYPTDDAAAVTDASGRFRLLGESTGKSVAIGATLDGFYVPDHAPIAVGTADARIVMSPAGGIAGSVRMPPDRKFVTIGVSGPTGDNGDTGQFFWERRRYAANDDGTFEIHGLRPGVARVSIRLGVNEEDVVAAFDDVQVVAGKITRDPRLQDVDPLKSLSTLKVVAVNKDGLGLPARVHFRPAGKSADWKEAGHGSTTTVRAKREEIAGGLDVLVTCGGFRSKIARDVRADTTVVLETAEWSSVRVRLAERTPLPPPPYQLSAKLYWIEPGAADERDGGWDPRNSTIALAGFGKDRVMTIEGLEPGRYRVVLFLGERDMNSSYSGSIDTDPKVVVATVGEDGATGEVVVGADPTEISRQTKRSR